MNEKLRKTAKYKKLKEDLIKQIVDKNNDTPVFRDMINQYMDLWLISEMLKEDIEERGVNTRYDNGGGQTGFKRNDSVNELNKVVTTMMKLLAQLKIQTNDDEVSVDSNDDFEL